MRFKLRTLRRIKYNLATNATFRNIHITNNNDVIFGKFLQLFFLN